MRSHAGHRRFIGPSAHGTFCIPRKTRSVHVLAAIASQQGIDHLQSHHPEAHMWVAAVDEELNDKGYIIPGLGDAGDLAFGSKL